MSLQTGQEFKQRNVEELNKKFNAEIYSTHLRGGKALVAEQKICGLKKLLLRNKQIEKATFNLNNTRSVKYGYSPEQIIEE